MRRVYRGAEYGITVRRAEHGEVPARMVDGAPWTRESLPIAAAGTVQQVLIIV